MLNTEAKVGNWQLIALLLFSQMFWLLSWPAPLPNPLLLMAAIIAATLLLSLVLGILSRTTSSAHTAHTFGKVVLWLFAFFVCLQGAVRLLTEVSILLEGLFDPLLVLISLTLALLAISALGKEALCRAAFVLFFFAFAALVLLLAAGWDQCHLLNLRPPEGIGNAFGSTFFYVLCGQAEIVLYLVLRPSVGHLRPRLYRYYLYLGVFIGGLLCALCGLVLGACASLGSYPFYVLSRAADLSALSQVTPLYWFLLLCSAALRLGAFFLMGLQAWPIRSVTTHRGLYQCLILLAAIIGVYYIGEYSAWLDFIVLALILCSSILFLIPQKRKGAAQ